ncbi:hypothetical protein GAR05_06172 [Micromonospora saelicesensis]|uniref:Uncharacterized protein n=1 Tax=Micromonospora saelicesensis TaxID=285676 RepID=A0ABX9CAH1_9ACTN|nr:hypothetical protein [Micromonospora saelicesensis]RAN92680.1 hypothetical protein GAR05_06172 [Micromonospora saelicesensis]
MCSISGTCGCDRGTGSFVLALVGRALWELVKILAKAVRLAFVALLAAAIWASPRAYRLARRGYRDVRRRYALRPVLLERKQPAAVTATTTAPTLNDLRLTKKEATVR